MDTALHIVSILLLAASVGYAAKQMRANHDWNRRKAAQDATMLLTQLVPDIEVLDDALGHSTLRDPIPLERITTAIEENPRLLRALHRYLNYYEALARGVRQAIYDERIIKVTCRGIMRQNWVQFEQYIAHRRNSGSPKAWTELEDLLNKWQAEEHEEPMR